MKHWLLGVLVVAVTATAPTWTEAKRIGSGGSAGMQRSAPAKTPPQSPPPQQAAQPAASPQQAAPAAPAAGAATAAAAAPAKRSWMGPIAGLAAGLGLAALMSHLGLGEAFANFLMMALLAVAVVFLIAFLMRRFGKPAAPATLSPAGAGASGSASWEPVRSADAQAPATVTARAAFTPAAADVSVTGQPLPSMGGAAVADSPAGEGPGVRAARWSDPLKAPDLPEGFDLPAFERVAKMIFIRLQAANDAADLDDLRQFTTPEMFAAIRLDLQDRSGATQHTDVQKVDASVVDFVTEAGRQIVSVRFHGTIREDAASAPEAFDEVWHLVKPEGEGSWAIAGIQQAQ